MRTGRTGLYYIINIIYIQGLAVKYEDRAGLGYMRTAQDWEHEDRA
jgi:hypothetical protein